MGGDSNCQSGTSCTSSVVNNGIRNNKSHSRLINHETGKCKSNTIINQFPSRPHIHIPNVNDSLATGDFNINKAIKSCLTWVFTFQDNLTFFDPRTATSSNSTSLSEICFKSSDFFFILPVAGGVAASV